MNKRLLVVPVVGALMLALTGCGTTSDMSSKSARELLSHMIVALHDVESYHFEGTAVDAEGPSHMTGDVDEFGDMRLSMRRGSKRAEAVRVGGEAFLTANREWWLAETAVARSGYADMLADRWVEIPSAAAVSPTLDALLPETMAHCFRQATGTLSRKGMREFSGGSVIVLADEGDRPRVSPGEIHIAASGPALPLRMIQTGPRTPGEVDPRCGDADSTITASDVRLSAFNDAVRITAPRDAIDFETLLRRSAVPA